MAYTCIDHGITTDHGLVTDHGLASARRKPPILHQCLCGHRFEGEPLLAVAVRNLHVGWEATVKNACPYPLKRFVREAALPEDAWSKLLW